MRITFQINAPDRELEQDLISLEILPETTVGVLKESIQAEVQISNTAQHIYHNGRLLSDESKTMEQLQIVDGDMLALHVRDIRGDTGVPAASRAQQPMQAAAARQGMQGAGGDAEADPETLRLRILGNPQYRQSILQRAPQLARVLENPQLFAQTIRQMGDEEQEAHRRRQREIAELNNDPFDLEAQARIEEMIREERVQENLQNAIDHTPEVFGRVHMLYIDVEVNGHPVKAFVDSGAQATIMSPSCAERCGILRLIDKRFAGIAKGVGTAAILGRVHSAQIKIASLFLACSFTVMEGKDVDMLLGLDMLKRYQASIDLAKDKLVIQGVEVPFLGEADIPKNMEEAREAEPMVSGPGGTTIGGRSGVIHGPDESHGAPGLSQQLAQPSSQAMAGPSGLASRPSQPAQPQAPSFPPESVDQLVALGFSREEATNALAACGGNVEYAAGLLFQG